MPRTKQLLLLIVAALTGIFSQSGFAVDTSQVHYSADSQQSFTGPDDYFTGEVQVKIVFPENETASYSGAYVTFQPGARTAWHFHPAGQHMIVTRGIGLTGTRDGKIVKFKAGETVWCPPGVDHWHGATPDAPMTHLVITGSLDGKNVIWKEKVTDAQYYGDKLPNDRGTPISGALSQRARHIIPIATFPANGRRDALKSALEDGLAAK